MPQLENGYTKIANELIDNFCRYRLSGEEWLIMWVIIRKTYGFNKKTDRIALSQFSQITGMKRQSVHRAIKSLSAKKLIAVIKKADREIVSYGVQKTYMDWEPVSKKATSKQKSLQSVSKKASRLSAILLPTKETIQNKVKERNIIPPTYEMVNKYCLERNHGVNAQKFIDHYTANGWYRGKNKVRDWQATVRTWEEGKQDGESRYKKFEG